MANRISQGVTELTLTGAVSNSRISQGITELYICPLTAANSRMSQIAVELILCSSPVPPPGPPVPGPGGCAEQSKLSVIPGLSVAGAAPPSIPGQTNSLKSQL